MRRAITIGVFTCAALTLGLGLGLALWPSSEMPPATSAPPARVIETQASNQNRSPPVLLPQPDASTHVAPAQSPQAREPDSQDASAPKLAEHTDAPPPLSSPAPRGAQYQSPSQRDRNEQLARASARVTSPGLCETEREARDALLAQFRKIDWRDASVLIDPALHFKMPNDQEVMRHE